MKDDLRYVFDVCKRYNPLFNSGTVRVSAQGSIKWGGGGGGGVIFISKASKLHQKQRVHILGLFFCAMQETDRQKYRDCLKLWKDVNCDNKVWMNLKIISTHPAIKKHDPARLHMLLIIPGFVLK